VLEHLTQLAYFFIFFSLFHHGFTLSVFLYPFSAPKMNVTPTMSYYLFLI
uniref:Uncharacterized protein n=2 Tax=Cercopithecidae TaxID=9527 RepID=A0A2K6CIN4_MACNE